MLATAAKLSRAVAATFDVLLSGLALEVQPGSFASGLLATHFRLRLGSGRTDSGRSYQSKEPTTFKGHRVIGGLFLISTPSRVDSLEASTRGSETEHVDHGGSARPFCDYRTIATENRSSKRGRKPLGLCGRLPQLNLIPIQIIDPGKATV